MQELTEGLGSSDPGAGRKIDRNRAILNYIRKSLRATRPWTRLLSVLGFIVTGLTVLAGIAMIVGKNFIPVSENAPPMTYIGIFYILTSVFYLVPSIWLSKYSSAIAAFQKSGDAVDFANAMAYQKSFWKFVGILALVSIVLTILGIVAAIIIPTVLSVRA